MRKGFTLIELMVSVTIFIVVMVIALGALLSISAAERKAEGLKTVMNNLNFGLESMSRAIRTGVNYHCDDSGVALDQPQDCPDPVNGSDYFAFTPVCVSGSSCPPPPVVYKYESSKNLCGVETPSVGGCIMVSQDSGANFFPITAPEVDITGLTFYVIGAEVEASSGVQPKVVITLTGTVSGNVSQSTNFNLQTSVTQRLYDQ